MWVQSATKKVYFCLIILARVAADTLSAKTRPGKSQLAPGPPNSLYEVRVEVLINAREFENLKSRFVISSCRLTIPSGKAISGAGAAAPCGAPSVPLTARTTGVLSGNFQDLVAHPSLRGIVMRTLVPHYVRLDRHPHWKPYHGQLMLDAKQASHVVACHKQQIAICEKGRHG